MIRVLCVGNEYQVDDGVGPAVGRWLIERCSLPTEVEVLDMADLGMEAVWRIRVADFPAFVVVDDKGTDFFARARDTGLSLGRTRTSARDGSMI